MTREIHYSSDTSIEDHANLVVFDNCGIKDAIYIERYEDTGAVLVYWVDLFHKPSDSWINEDDIPRINSCCDTKYKFNEELDEFDQYLFTSDLCSYYGAINFDSYPLHFDDQDEFEEWLTEMNLIDQ